MLEKIKRKLDKKFEALPLHHIDTSVLIEPEKTDDGKHCRKYLQKVGYSYRGILSFPVLSELFVKIDSLEDDEDKLGMLRLVSHLRKYKMIAFYSSKSGDIMEELGRTDNRLQQIDIEIIASAIEHKAMNLVTLDRQLLHHKSIEERFGLKILHPKELA